MDTKKSAAKKTAAAKVAATKAPTKKAAAKRAAVPTSPGDDVTVDDLIDTTGEGGETHQQAGPGRARLTTQQGVPAGQGVSWVLMLATLARPTDSSQTGAITRRRGCAGVLRPLRCVPGDQSFVSLVQGSWIRRTVVPKSATSSDPSPVCSTFPRPWRS